MPDFDISRSLFIDASPDRVSEFVTDFHKWRDWSPWEDVDPDLHRTYSEPASGVGATYAWEGNKKAGIGSMEITGVAPEQVDVRLRFLKPFKQDNEVIFELPPRDSGTEVTWRMRGRTTGMLGLMSRLWPMDKLVGKDFEKGLAQLKAVSER